MDKEEIEIREKLKILKEKSDKLKQELKVLNNYEKNLRNKLVKIIRRERFPRICKTIDELFALPENKDCNIVLLNGSRTTEDGRYVFETSDWDLEDTITIVKESDRNTWATAANWTVANGEALEKFYSAANSYIPSSKKIFKEDPSINMYWYGIVAVTKEHTLVSFVCRNDGLMMDDAPSVILDFNRGK